MQLLSRFFARLTPGGTAATGASTSSSSSSPRQKAGGNRARPPSSYEDSTPLAAQADRTQRRDQLYDIVRECMMRINVLSSNYKFKVLALDSRGAQFLVMMDLATNALHEDRWSETEALISHTATARFDIGVKGVYWRVNPQLAEALAAARTIGAAPGVIRRPHLLDLPLGEQPTQPAALDGFDPRRKAAMAMRGTPVEADEMTTLNQVLAQARRPAETPPAVEKPARRSVWRSKSALAGFEETRLLLPDPEPDRAAGLTLGPTQFGDLN